MPLTLTNAMNSGAQLGSGSNVSIHIDGDIHPGDFLVAYLSHLPVSGAGDQILAATCTFHNTILSSIVTPQMYFNCDISFTTFGQFTPFFGGVSGWPTDGDSVYVHAEFFHSFVSVASDDTIGFTYRANAGIPNLFLALSRTLQGQGGSGLTDILNAVRRVATTPGQV